MKQQIYVLFVLLMACTFKSKPIEVESALDESTLAPKESIFCMPIHIAFKDIERKANKSIQKHLIKDQRTEDGLVINVTRNGRIKIYGKGGSTFIKLPLNIHTRKGDKIRFAQSEFSVDIHLKTILTTNANWNISTKSEVVDIQWIGEPKTQILAVPVNLKGTLEKHLEKKKKDIAQSIDQSINERVNLRKPVGKIWKNMQRPHNITKSMGESLYLYIKPQKIAYVNHTVYRTGIQINVQVLANMFASTRALKSVRQKAVSLPRLMLGHEKCKGFHSVLNVDLYFDDLNEVLNSRLADKRFTLEGHDVNVKDINIRPSAQNLFVKMHLSEPVEAEFSALVELSIDKNLKKIQFDVQKIHLDEGDLALEFANALIKDYLMEELAERSGFQYDTYLHQIPDFIVSGIAKGKSGDKWHPEIEQMKCEIGAVQVTEEGLHFRLHGRGSGSIILDKLKSGR